MKIRLDPSKNSDDSRMIDGALKILSALGGGILELGPGIYTSKGIRVPSGCVITGKGIGTPITSSITKKK